MNSKQWIAVVAAGLVVCLSSACSGSTELGTGPIGAKSNTPTAAGSPTSTKRQAVPVAFEIPDTPAGKQLRWFLDRIQSGSISEQDATAHFNKAFLQQVPASKLTLLLPQLKTLRLTRLSDDRPTALGAEGTVADQKVRVTVGVGADGKMHTLLFGPAEAPKLPKAPASWSELDQRLGKLAPNSGLLAAEVTSMGECKPIHSVSADKPQPIGSMFKLYVLKTISDRIAAGKLTWDTKLTIEQASKSLPSGELQDRPAGSKVTVREAARLMISISDNTATDLLIRMAGGRAAVEAVIAKTSEHATLNTPLLTTRDLFVLKLADYPSQAKKYLVLGPDERRRYLDDTVAKAPLPEVPPSWTTTPREIESLEWFASPNDICRIYAALAPLEASEVGKAMSVNDGQLGLDKKRWPTVWFKGGSEPGVLALGYLAMTNDGKQFVVAAMLNNPKAAVSETTIGPELISIAQGAFALASAE